MSWQVIATQVVVVAINVYLARTENIRRLMAVTFLFNCANLLMYLSNSDRTTVLMYVIICVRAFVYIFREQLQKYKFIPFLFISAHILVGFLTVENAWEIMPMLIPCYTCFYLWFYKTTQKIRIGNVIANSLWLIYNVKTGLFIVSASRMVTVINNIVAYVQKKDTALGKAEEKEGD